MSKIKISCKDDLIKATWLEHEDEESGVALAEWCVETGNGTCNIQEWKSVQPRTVEASAIIQSLPAINSVRVVVRITNGAGNFVIHRSSECNAKGTFPPQINVSVIPQLNDTRPVSLYQTNTDVIIVTWSLPQNKSLYSRVQAALAECNRNETTTTARGKWHGERLVFSFVDIPKGRSYIIFSGTRLNPYVKLRPIVRICNRFGLCTDSSGDPVVIIPDAPPEIQVNTTDTVEGTEHDRWKTFLEIPRLPREIFEGTLFMPDPLNVMIQANVQKVKKTILFSKHVPMTYKASVYRVTSGANDARNVTFDLRQIFNDSHFHNELVACCSKRNKHPRIVYPDRQYKPVMKTSLFGVTVSAFNKDLIAVSSQKTVYLFSIESLHITPISHVTFNTSNNDSYVKVKAKNDTVLVSVSGSLVLQRIHNDNISTSSSFYITNCNYTMKNAPEHCKGDDHWSSFKSTGEEFAYDGNELVAVSGRDPHQGYSVVAVFKNNENSWTLHQVLGHKDKNFNTPYSIAINRHFMVIAGPQISVYSKTLYSVWKKETILSESLSQNPFSAKAIYLTKENELFVLTMQTRTLNVFELNTSTATATQKCKYVVSRGVEIIGGLDVSETSAIVAAIGMRLHGKNGAELVLYERNEGCTKVGGVLSKTAPRFDDNRLSASVAITGNLLIIGTPGRVAWPTDYVDVGTGRLYVTTFCKRNQIRKKILDDDQKERIICAPCRRDENAYPGFEEQCSNCRNTICMNQTDDARFKVSHCQTYPCNVQINQTIRQNVSRDNLTVIERTETFKNQEFYLPGSKHRYFIRLTQLSATGMTKDSDSFPFSIDYTSPKAGSVFDGLGSDDSGNCSSNTTFSSENQCTSRSFSETDLDYTNNTYEISARWLDFHDDESNIAHFLWCVGSKPILDDIMACENATGNLNRTLKGLSLQHNDMYYVTVLACNYAGLCTAKSSDGVLVDTTPPLMEYVRDGLVGPDIDFQVSQPCRVKQ